MGVANYVYSSYCMNFGFSIGLKYFFSIDFPIFVKSVISIPFGSFEIVLSDRVRQLDHDLVFDLSTSSKTYWKSFKLDWTELFVLFLSFQSYQDHLNIDQCFLSEFVLAVPNSSSSIVRCKVLSCSDAKLGVISETFLTIWCKGKIFIPSSLYFYFDAEVGNFVSISSKFVQKSSIFV